MYLYTNILKKVQPKTYYRYITFHIIHNSYICIKIKKVNFNKKRNYLSAMCSDTNTCT